MAGHGEISCLYLLRNGACLMKFSVTILLYALFITHNVLHIPLKVVQNYVI